MGAFHPTNEVHKPVQFRNGDSSREGPQESALDQHGKGRNGRPMNSSNSSGMKRSNSSSVFSDMSLIQSSSSGVVQRDSKLRKIQGTKAGKKQSSSSEHECPICSKVCASPAEMRKHMEVVHHGRRDHICEHCGKAFGFGNDLRRHIRTVHEKRRDYHCPFEGCGKSFAHGWTLNNHIKMQHEAKWRPSVPAVRVGPLPGSAYDQSALVSMMKYGIAHSPFDPMNQSLLASGQIKPNSNDLSTMSGIGYHGIEVPTIPIFMNPKQFHQQPHQKPQQPGSHHPSSGQALKPNAIESNNGNNKPGIDMNAPSAFRAHRSSSSSLVGKSFDSEKPTKKHGTRSRSNSVEKKALGYGKREPDGIRVSKRSEEDRPIASSSVSLVSRTSDESHGSDSKPLKFTPRGSAEALSALLEIAYREQNCAA